MSPIPASSPIDQEVKAEALDLLDAHPNGMKTGDLVNAILSKHVSLKRKVVEWAVWEFSKDSQVYRPVRGLLRLSKYVSLPSSIEKPDGRTPSRENDFYQPFAEWLRSEGEATEAESIGGAIFKTKWATPDVIGVYKKEPTDPFQFPAELISAELKTDATQSIVAFGQAISYRLFSHKTILAMPADIETLGEDHERLKALCNLFGVGYVVFDKDAPTNPSFRYVVWPRRFEPDMFYANSLARQLIKANPKKFNKLF